MRKLKWRDKPYKTFRKDIEDLKVRIAYKKLRNKLSLKSHRESDEALIEANDSSAEDYSLASDLFLIAKDEYDKFATYYEIEMSRLNFLAQSKLEKKKKKKELSSQITKDLKKDWIIKNRTEEYEYLERKKRELKTIMNRMEIIKESWKQRMSSLQSQARAVEFRRQRLGGKKIGREEKDN